MFSFFSRSKSKPKNNSKHVIDSLLDAKTIIDGNVIFSTGMQIHGRVRGDVRGMDPNAVLDIGKDAVIEGAVEAAHIFIDGTIIGPIKASIMVVVRPNGKITGDVHYGKIQMEEGSQIRGQLLPMPAPYASPVQTDQIDSAQHDGDLGSLAQAA